MPKPPDSARLCCRYVPEMRACKMAVKPVEDDPWKRLILWAQGLFGLVTHRSKLPKEASNAME
jgi:hypothetical protein